MFITIIRNVADYCLKTTKKITFLNVEIFYAKVFTQYFTQNCQLWTEQEGIGTSMQSCFVLIHMYALVVICWKDDRKKAKLFWPKFFL
jgi:hypothetical protein